MKTQRRICQRTLMASFTGWSTLSVTMCLNNLPNSIMRLLCRLPTITKKPWLNARKCTIEHYLSALMKLLTTSGLTIQSAVPHTSGTARKRPSHFTSSPNKTSMRCLKRLNTEWWNGPQASWACMLTAMIPRVKRTSSLKEMMQAYASSRSCRRTIPAAIRLCSKRERRTW